LRLALELLLVLVLVLSLAVLPIRSSAAPPAQDAGPNLLQDGGFEWAAPWPGQDGQGTVQIAQPWRAWWVGRPPTSVPKPYNCADAKDYGCYWAVPEFKDVQKLAYAYRVHGGLQSQTYFTYGRMHWAGLMQKVGNIQPDTRLRFSVYLEAWMCYEWLDCDYGKVSDKPSDMHLKIGIDPTGGEDPFSPNIVWSPEQRAWDQWVQFQVEAVARSDTVTVFTHSRADWDWARKNNDVYIDDASLVALGVAPTVQPTKPAAAPAQSRASQSQRATQTPAPPTATNTPTPTLTLTPTPTETSTPTETPVRRVATLPPDDTATPGPARLIGNLSSLGDSPGGFSGVILLGVAVFLSALLVGVVAGQRRGRRL
jgi:hypothetical protein